MKITKKKLDYYNTRGPFPSYNENYNVAHGLPSMQEWGLMNKIRAEHFGICGGKITMHMIKKAQGE